MQKHPVYWYTAYLAHTTEIFMSIELEKLMRPDEMQRLNIASMNEEEQQTLFKWGMRMYSLGQHIVADIQDIKYGGRLIVLDDGTRWEVEATDSTTAELWSSFDKVVVIDDEMYKLDDTEKVGVQKDYE
jgi:hypothetical protein